jgi:hypothetical protein
MNERMLELYRQAQVPHTAIDPSNNMLYETTCFSAEKFAELIVKECVDVAGKDWYTPDGWGRTSGQSKAIEFITEHFRIKE